MRRIAAAIVLITVTLGLAACGGSGDAATSGTGGAGTGAAAPPAAVTPAAATTTDTKSPIEVVDNEQFPTQVDVVPTAILDRLKAKQPMLIVYYDSTQEVTGDQQAEIDAVMKKYRGLIDLVSYDVQSETGEGATKDPEVQKALEMAGLLGVKYPPYLLFVDRYGRITGRFSGYTDEALIEREVLRATS